VIITDSQNDPRFSSAADRKTGFITLILARYWPEDGKIHFSRAGHLPPLLMSGNKILDVPDMKGISLGVLADAVFEKKELLLSPGHSLFFITDGLTEAENENRELLGDRAVHDLLCNASGPPRGPDILKDLAAYRGSAPPSDDLTIVEIRRETD
jgi:phosphoserine phosphatase RsbU/P